MSKVHRLRQGNLSHTLAFASLEIPANDHTNSGHLNIQIEKPREAH